MSATPEQVAHYQRLADEARGPSLVAGTANCPACGPVEHTGYDDESHCPCVEWEGADEYRAGDSLGDWRTDPLCPCRCHER